MDPQENSIETRIHEPEFILKLIRRIASQARHYHGTLTQEEAKSLVVEDGEFLFREDPRFSGVVLICYKHRGNYMEGTVFDANFGGFLYNSGFLFGLSEDTLERYVHRAIVSGPHLVVNLPKNHMLELKPVERKFDQVEHHKQDYLEQIEQQLMTEIWYHSRISKDEAEEQLVNYGDFLVTHDFSGEFSLRYKMKHKKFSSTLLSIQGNIIDYCDDVEPERYIDMIRACVDRKYVNCSEIKRICINAISCKSEDKLKPVYSTRWHPVINKQIREELAKHDWFHGFQHHKEAGADLEKDGDFFVFEDHAYGNFMMALRSKDVVYRIVIARTNRGGLYQLTKLPDMSPKEVADHIKSVASRLSLIIDIQTTPILLNVVPAKRFSQNDSQESTDKPNEVESLSSS